MSEVGGRPENLTPFKKGCVSKGGRPKGSVSIVTSLKKLLKSNANKIPQLDEIVKRTGVKKMSDALAIKLVLMVFQKGKTETQLKALIEIMNRVDGKEAEKNINLDFDVSKMSDEELRQIIEN